MAPGTRALAFASRWFDPQTVSTVFEPLVADWQREWQDAAGFARFGVRIRGGAADLFFAPRWSGPWLALAVMVVSSVAIDQMRHRAARRTFSSFLL